MKNNIKAKMVNELRNIAIEFHNHDCLREKLIGVLIKYFDRDWYVDTNYSLEGLIADVELMDERIKALKAENAELKSQIKVMRNCDE